VLRECLQIMRMQASQVVTHGDSMVKERDEIILADRWNVEALYPSLEAWEKEFGAWKKKDEVKHFSELLSYKGSLVQSSARVAEFLKKYLHSDRQLTKLYTYAHLKHDEDVGNDKYKQAFSRIVVLMTDFKEATAWVEPELLQMSPSAFDALIKSPDLEEYRLLLEKIWRLKPHTLSAEKEELLASASLALETSEKVFGAFNNGDIKFPSVVDSQGNVKELTHGKYYLYMRDQDRKLRENAFKTLHRTYLGFENMLCELINGEVQKHFFEAKARNYKSCLEAALFPHQIDPSVYTSLIETTRKHLGSLHRYLSLRKKALGVEMLHLWDLSVPLVKQVDLAIDFPSASEKVIASVQILGEKYQGDLKKGLRQDRWVDVYENVRKRSGAYSSGCYDSMPYILMNYQGTFNDMMTLSHEAGHSMHTLLSARHQPYHYSRYPIFVAEVASTFNEELLFRHLLEHETNRDMRCYLINQKIDDIRSTFFRQVMFAEFELRLHEWVERGTPLTPALLKKEYAALNREYFGDVVYLDEEIEIEWARIPHFYYDFYVYQYATGISAALALVEKMFQEKDRAREGYLRFLSSGCSLYPLDLLERAGVNMRQPEAVEATIRLFDHLVTELENLL
jgi:oligoendopeptidase F